MKKIKPFLFLPLLLPLMGCELIEEEFDVSLSFDGDLNITSVSPAGDIDDPVSVRTEIAKYDISSDPDVAELISDKSEIKKIKIDRIRYSYKYFEGNDEALVLEGGFSFLVIYNNERIVQITDTDVNIAEADSRNDSFSIAGDFSSVEEGLNERFQTILISYFGTLSRNPVDFKVAIKVDVTVTIKPDIDNF